MPIKFRGNRFLMSGVVGVTAAVGVGVVAFVLGMFLPNAQGSRFLDPFEMYLRPAGILAPVTGPLLLSTKLVYWLVPDGGAPAGVFLIVLCSLLFWAILFGVAYFVWSSVRRKQRAERQTGIRAGSEEDGACHD